MYFSDYQNAVLDIYKKELNAGALPLTLAQPTPAELKKLCLRVLANRLENGDKRILADFFGGDADAENIAKNIRAIDTDKFKPLIRYMKGEIRHTNSKNVELLAWLLNLYPRPYRMGEEKLPALTAHRMADAGSEKESATASELKTEAPQKVANPSKRQRFIGIGLLAISLSGYFVHHQLSVTEQCMYWNGNAYQTISCNEKVADNEMIALNDALVTDFKKIDSPDTITEYSIGRAGYFKKDNHLEFFTSTGSHPVLHDKALKPLSQHIYETYILPLKKNAIGK